MRIFKRKLYDKLLDWKNNRKGKTAVMIEGARRVGKSTLAKQFAENEYDSYVLIDFSIAPKEITELFDYISDLEYFFMQLQFRLGVSLIEHKSLIIFDEVQICPKARQAIKHLVADGRYDYIETGSLISIRKNVKDIVIPSEEEKMALNPMDYEEFKWALDDTTTIPQLRMLFDKKMSIGDAVTRKLMRDFRIYMVVGGMPQAVSEYLDSHNLQEVDRAKRGIIQLYEDDFYKIDPSGRISSLFDAIPAQLNSNASRYQITSAIGDNADSEKVFQLISELRESHTINMAYHANDPGVGMSLSMDVAKYKMYVADTGPLHHLGIQGQGFHREHHLSEVDERQAGCQSWLRI